MTLIYLIFTLVSQGDMFIVRYPVSDSIRGMVYAPLDTFCLEDSVSLFSTNLGVININSTKNIRHVIDSVYKTILPETRVIIDRYVKVSVIGEVKKPYVGYINENEPISSLIGLAGGTTPLANLKKIKIYTHSKTFKINYYEAVEKHTTIKELGLFSGDAIEVSKKFHVNFSDITSIISAIVLLWSFYQTNF